MRLRGGDRGTASLELVGMLPVVALVVGTAIYLSATVWTANGANVAVRDGARAASLGQDVEATVNGSLPGGLHAVTTRPDLHSVRVVVTLDAAPDISATREASMP